MRALIGNHKVIRVLQLISICCMTLDSRQSFVLSAVFKDRCMVFQTWRMIETDFFAVIRLHRCHKHSSPSPFFSSLLQLYPEGGLWKPRKQQQPMRVKASGYEVWRSWISYYGGVIFHNLDRREQKKRKMRSSRCSWTPCTKKI